MSTRERIPYRRWTKLKTKILSLLYPAKDFRRCRPEISANDSASQATAKLKKNRGRVDIVRQTAGRGGKTVTVVKNFVGIGLPEKEQLAKAMQRACGTGGTVKDGQIEIQGDKREEVARILTKANFRPVFAGG
ncbi:MAG: translation initiation factor [Limisphaerales bacterium]